jgi:hypothetical protein
MSLTATTQYEDVPAQQTMPVGTRDGQGRTKNLAMSRGEKIAAGLALAVVVCGFATGMPAPTHILASIESAAFTPASDVQAGSLLRLAPAR